MIRNRMTFNSCLKRQKGFTAVGWAVVISIGLFFAYLGMILMPYIVGGYTMDRILQGLKEEPNIAKKSKSEIWRLIENRLTINQVRDVKREDFEIKKEPNMTTVYFDYDDRAHFMGNIYIVIERSKSVELYRDY
ncbi:MAG: DUF4845 domain-containing protein [gamma proteobacterium symbiont of Taylorina sp.]|nr:DUF4845 domain-containing protein [gamma proteobacterium symbiont of Taylorina sp.]